MKVLLNKSQEMGSEKALLLPGKQIQPVNFYYKTILFFINREMVDIS